MHAREDFERRPTIAERDVAAVIDDIVGCDDIIPAIDECAIHLLDRHERTTRVAEDVRVIVVRVGGVPDSRFHRKCRLVAVGAQEAERRGATCRARPDGDDAGLL